MSKSFGLAINCTVKPDADDLAALRAAEKAECDAPTIPLGQVVEELELTKQ